ncbi:MAG: hypothetical protein BWY83_02646 [bacterium ADurb.Bin478]|nr:MAG: hypothetical protein BWY83_02646 [bacterium ADurb.Bin478]
MEAHSVDKGVVVDLAVEDRLSGGGVPMADGAVLTIDKSTILHDKGIALHIAQIKRFAGAEVRSHQVAHVGKDAVFGDHLAGAVIGANVIAVGVREDDVIQFNAAAHGVGLNQAALHVVHRGRFVFINAHHADIFDDGMGPSQGDAPPRRTGGVAAGAGWPQVDDRQRSVALTGLEADCLAGRNGQRGILEIDLAPFELVDAIR